MFNRFATIAAVVMMAASLCGPASALTYPDEVLAQATQTPTTTPKAPATNLPKATGTAPAPQPAAPAGLVDINSASEADLQTLSGIGPARAKAIIAGRPCRQYCHQDKVDAEEAVTRQHQTQRLRQYARRCPDNRPQQCRHIEPGVVYYVLTS